MEAYGHTEKLVKLVTQVDVLHVSGASTTDAGCVQAYRSKHA